MKSISELGELIDSNNNGVIERDELQAWFDNNLHIFGFEYLRGSKIHHRHFEGSLAFSDFESRS